MTKEKLPSEYADMMAEEDTAYTNAYKAHGEAVREAERLRDSDDPDKEQKIANLRANATALAMQMYNAPLPKRNGRSKSDYDLGPEVPGDGRYEETTRRMEEVFTTIVAGGFIGFLFFLVIMVMLMIWDVFFG